MGQFAPRKRKQKWIADGAGLRSGVSFAAGLAAAIVYVVPASAQQQLASLSDLGRMSIEQLANMEITSVSKRPQPVSDAAASVYVITAEDIRRSGATSIPEILRLAPNLQVAQLGAQSYAISSRGFNHSTGTANKLLVMIDGRTVYSPLFSGTFWDVQNVPIGDIERIEVVSGPGGVLWGSNAVNGVINIVTRDSADTQGPRLDLREGNNGSNATLRYGGKLGDDATWRVYGMGFRENSTELLSGKSGHDGWQNVQGGFRADWHDTENSVTLEGDLYRASDEPTPGVVFGSGATGANIVASWQRGFDDGSALKTQVYYDDARRAVASGILAKVETYDFDTQYNFSLGDSHSIVAGAGYRLMNDSFRRGPHTTFLDPADSARRLANIFANDEIKLAQAWRLTLGLKLENNSYTGLEYMPDVRLAWDFSDTGMVWTGVSRAVRTPSRFDTNLVNPGLINASPNFESEDLLAYELGYRDHPLASLSYSISAYYNVYDHLRTLESPAHGFFPLTIGNKMRGDTWGVEAWGNYAAAGWWRLSAGVSTLHKDLDLEPGSRDRLFGVAYAGNDPDWQAQLRSSMDLPRDLEFDFGLRAVGALPSPKVASYLEADTRLGWKLNDTFTLSFAATNLLDGRHVEFINGSTAAHVLRASYYVGLQWGL